MIMDYKQVKADVLKQYDAVMPLIKEIKGDSATTFDTPLAQLQRDVENIRNDIFRLMIVGEAIAQLNKLLRHFEVVRELLHLLYGQRAEAVIRQANYHECSGNNVVDVTVLITQSAVQGQTFQLAFLITD